MQRNVFNHIANTPPAPPLQIGDAKSVAPDLVLVVLVAAYCAFTAHDVISSVREQRQRARAAARAADLAARGVSVVPGAAPGHAAASRRNSFLALQRPSSGSFLSRSRSNRVMATPLPPATPGGGPKGGATSPSSQRQLHGMPLHPDLLASSQPTAVSYDSGSGPFVPSDSTAQRWLSEERLPTPNADTADEVALGAGFLPKGGSGDENGPRALGEGVEGRAAQHDSAALGGGGVTWSRSMVLSAGPGGGGSRTWSSASFESDGPLSPRSPGPAGNGFVAAGSGGAAAAAMAAADEDEVVEVHGMKVG